MPSVDDIINMLAEARTPAGPTTSVSVKIPKEQADELKALAKEINMKYPQLVGIMFEDGCARVLKAAQKIPRKST